MYRGIFSYTRFFSSLVLRTSGHMTSKSWIVAHPQTLYNTLFTYLTSRRQCQSKLLLALSLSISHLSCLVVRLFVGALCV